SVPTTSASQAPRLFAARISSPSAVTPPPPKSSSRPTSWSARVPPTSGRGDPTRAIVRWSTSASRCSVPVSSSIFRRKRKDRPTMNGNPSTSGPSPSGRTDDSLAGPVLTRRRLLQRAGGGFGLIGLAGLLQQEGLLETGSRAAEGLGD